MTIRRFAKLLLFVAVTPLLLVYSFYAAGQGVGETEAQKDRKKFFEDDQCIICHLEAEMMPEGFLEDDVHMQDGLSCAGCHGGDALSDDEDAAMSKKAGFVGVPSKTEILEFCGKCHSKIEFMRRFQPRIPTDQVSQYLTSIHGKKLLAGDDNVADCAGCHTSHGILSARDARSSVYALNVPATCNKCHGDADLMSEYGIRADQYEKYARGVHGVALLVEKDTGAPACNDCHGNHGAVPPVVASVSQVCGNCHVNNMQYFSASKMASAFEKEDLHGCEECHGNHDIEKTSDEMVGVGERSVCIDCHTEGDEGYAAARLIGDHLNKLTSTYASALEKQEDVRRKGMDDVEIEFLLQDSHQSLIEARTLVHTFDPDKVGPKTDEGVEKAVGALELAEAAIKDFHVRRRGFGMATVFITILVVALFFKIRQIERA